MHDTPTEADTFFPEIDQTVWKETEREDHEKDEKHEQSYSFVDMIRR